MSWTVLFFIGIISYAATGAFIALEERYSFIGVFALGLTTSFGGAVIRNLIIGVPISQIWDIPVIITVFMTLTVIILLPPKWLKKWDRYRLHLDSIGLGSFALNGAMAASVAYENEIGVIILAAMFTGVGGGIIRDVLAGRRPLALKEEIHAVLTVLAAVWIWLGWDNPLQLTIIVLVIFGLRMSAIHYRWHLPLPSNHSTEGNTIIK